MVYSDYLVSIEFLALPDRSNRPEQSGEDAADSGDHLVDMMGGIIPAWLSEELVVRDALLLHRRERIT